MQRTTNENQIDEAEKKADAVLPAMLYTYSQQSDAKYNLCLDSRYRLQHANKHSLENTSLTT